MAASEPSVRDLIWRGLNPLGRVVTVLMIANMIWLLLALILPWEPLKVILTREPSLGHYVANVLLFMIDIPLAWTAWKSLKSDRGRRVIIVMALLFILITFIEARIALQKDERWRPQMFITVFYSLLFIQLGLGRKRPFPSGIPDPPRVT